MNIVLARLRMNCSNLNGHLFNLKLTDNPSCPCGYFFEDSVHFFFYLSIVHTGKPHLHNYVSRLARNFNLSVLLHGSPNLGTQDNASIIKSVILFIKATMRFAL